MRELYRVDPTTLAHLPADKYHAKKLTLLMEHKLDLVREIEQTPVEDGYEAVQANNHLIKYIDKAIKANHDDLAELTGTYTKETR